MAVVDETATKYLATVCARVYVLCATAIKGNRPVSLEPVERFVYPDDACRPNQMLRRALPMPSTISLLAPGRLKSAVTAAR